MNADPLASCLPRESLSPQDEAIANLETFVRHVSPRMHVADHVLRVIRHVGPALVSPVRRLLCMPPRHGKTSLLMHLMALAMLNGRRVAYATYSDERSDAVSAEFRRFMFSDPNPDDALGSVTKTYESCGFAPLRIGAKGGTADKRLGRWSIARTGAVGGGMIRLDGIQGGWTGEGFDLIVIDDPIRGRKLAESGPERETAWRAFYSDIRTRKVPTGTAIVLVHTRWHIDDIAGRVLEGRAGERYEPLILPAIDGEGRALWPEYFPVESFTADRADPYDWASLFQQEPRPRGTEVFGEPARYDLDEWLAEHAGHLHDHFSWIWALDPAASTSTHADFSSAVLMAMRGTGERCEAWLVDRLHVQAEVPDVVARLVRMRNEWAERGAMGPIAVEAVAGFAAVPQMIRRLIPGVPVHAVKVGGADKRTRSTAYAAAWNAKRVHVPTGSKWDGFVNEHCIFTGQDDPHDDDVDAGAHAFNALWRSAPPLERRTIPNRIFGLG